MRAVVDTNIPVSALLFGGVPSQIIELSKEGRIELFISPFILDEFEKTLKSKFGYSAEDAREARADVEAISRTVQPQVQVHAVRRKDSDNRILECAVEAKAEVLVTGNMGDLRNLGAFQGIAILTPREFIDRYFPGI